MNYGRNMPDWHQFNASQTNEVPTVAQNVNSGHMTYISGVSPSSLNTINLGSEGLDKHQNDSNYNPRHYQSLNNVSNNPNISNNTPLTSMVQMQNCISHYGSPNTRNPMLDNLSTPVDPRNTAIGSINDDLGYRTNQVPYNGSIAHFTGPSCNVNPQTVHGPGSGTRPGVGPGVGSGHNSMPGSRHGVGSRPASGLGPVHRHSSVHSGGSGSGPGPGPGSVSGPGPGPGPGLGPGAISGHGTRSEQAPGSVPASGLSHGPGTASHGTMGPRNPTIGSMPQARSGPTSFIPCKGLCCNPDANINYQQWEQFGSYQANTTYKDTVHPAAGYQNESRHFGNACNYRKSGFENKEALAPAIPNASNMDHQRNYTDYKSHKDHMMSRNYTAPTGMIRNYPIQNYNYPGDYQKYPYVMKEHSKTNGMNVANPEILKHEEQNFVNQQKYNNKQYQYQNQNGNILPARVPTLNVNPNMLTTPQNSYFNSQFPRNVSTEVPHECQETTDNTAVVNRMQPTFMQGSHSRYQLYQQKISMQKYSMENHLKELSRIPGYQSHPKYKEYILKYREILKLQQNTGYQNQIQQSPRVATPVNPAVPPINLQFDQNGMLINSTYMPNNFSKLQHVTNTEQRPDNIDQKAKDHGDPMSKERQQGAQQTEQLIILSQNEHMSSLCGNNFQKQSQHSIQKDFNQNQLKVQTNDGQNFDHLSTNTSDESLMQQKVSKEFTKKPDLDVRQFLANWDETEDEEGTVSNIPDAVLSETTPVVVVSYENVDLSTKTPQSTDISEQNSFESDETTFTNQDKDKGNVITTQDCLTISYSTPESSEIPKPVGHTIREGVVKPGSIIHCISNGPDEIPTIHIVDNLEISNILGASNDHVIETLENQKAISFFRKKTATDGGTSNLQDTDQHEKNEASELSLPPIVNMNKQHVENSNISGTIQTATISNQDLRVLSGSPKSNLGSSENLHLKKQNSFTCEESHNTDDISLPDLPTSECTPISTTLNTPTHSDSEEPSDTIEDLSMQTNPIEIMQNSPVISFTQSPVKMEPYGQLSNEGTMKNRSLDSIQLEFRKQDRYVNNDTNNASDQAVSLNDFDFSVNNSRIETDNITKNREVQSHEKNSVKKKSFLVDDKDNDLGIPDTSPILSSIDYEFNISSGKVQNMEVDNCKLSTQDFDSCDSSNFLQEARYKSVKKLTSESTQSTSKHVPPMNTVVSNISNAKLSIPTESEDEVDSLRMSKSSREVCQNQKRRSISTSSTANTSSDTDSNSIGNSRERETFENKLIEDHLDRHLNKNKQTKAQKRNMEHSKQLKDSDIKKFVKDTSDSSQTEEHSVCHTTFHNKNYSTAVIRDNATSSDKEVDATAEKNSTTITVQQHRSSRNVCCKNPAEFQSQTANAESFSKEAEVKKIISNKLFLSEHEHVHSLKLNKSERLQNDLRTVDGDIKHTKERLRMLKDYRKRKNKISHSNYTHDEHQKKREQSTNEKDNALKADNERSTLQKLNDTFYQKHDKIECSQLRRNNESLAVQNICLEQNLASMMNVHADGTDISDLERQKHMFSKNFLKNPNSDFGFQVANVNLKIKDSEIRKGLHIGDNTQKHIKDSLDGIKIEINVSCTERNVRGEEYNQRLLCDNFRNADHRNIYQLGDSLSNTVGTHSTSTSDCQCQLHTKEPETTNDQIHKIPELSHSSVEVVTIETNKQNDLSTSTGDDQGTGINKENNEIITTEADTPVSIVSKETGSTGAEKQPGNKMYNNESTDHKSHGTSGQSNVAAIEDTSNSPGDINTIRTHSVTSNTSLAETNSKQLTKVNNRCQDDTEKDTSVNVKDNPAVKVQVQDSCSKSTDTSLCLESIAETFNAQKSNEDGLATVSNLLQIPSKWSDDNLVKLNMKSLNSLEFNFEKLDYRKCSGVNFDRGHLPAGEIVEFDDNCIVKWKKAKIDPMFQDCDMLESTSGYINPIFSSIDKLENLQTVPVYTTKDGKISYSPNRRFTFHKLMMEARKREEACTVTRKSYSDALSNYHSHSKFRKLYKKKRHYYYDKKKQTDFKDTRFPYERRKSYLDESCSKTNVKFKDHIHNIKALSAACLGYYNVDKVYSSSDSDIEITSCGKTDVDTSNREKNGESSESKHLYKLCKSKIVANTSDVQKKSDEVITATDSLCESTEVPMDESQSIKLSSCDKDNDDHKNTLHESTAVSDLVPSEHATIANLGTDSNSSMSAMKSSVACDDVSKNLCTGENENCGDELSRISLNADKIENKDTPVDNPENVDVGKESDLSLSTKVSTLNPTPENEEMCTSRTVENEEYISEEAKSKNLDYKDNVDMNTKIIKDNNMEVDEKTVENPKETCGDLEISETLKLNENHNDTFQESSEVSSVLEECKNSTVEELDMSSVSSINNKMDVEQFETFQADSPKHVDENVKFCQEESNENEEKQTAQDITIDEQNGNREAEKEIQSTEDSLLEHENSNDTSKEETLNTNNNISIENQEEFQFERFQTNETNNEQNKSELLSVKTNENTEEDINSEKINIVESKTCSKEPECPDLEMAIVNTNELDENDVDKINVNVPSATDTPEKDTTDNVQETQSNENHSEITAKNISEDETSISRESSIEIEMPVLNMYCSIKNSSDEDIESREKPTDTKVPKLVIKKTETPSSKSERSTSYGESNNPTNRYDSTFVSSKQPKIPKMVIAKNRSRSVTPSIEVLEIRNSERVDSPSGTDETTTDTDNSDSESYTLKYKDESKTANVKMQLEDDCSKDLKLYLKRKDVKKSIPKMKIRRVKIHSSGPVEDQTQPLKAKFETLENLKKIDLITDSDNDNTSLHELLHGCTEKTTKMPKLKLKKQEEEKISSPERIKKKDTNIMKPLVRSTKTVETVDIKQSGKYNTSSTPNDTEEKKDATHGTSEKIPKVIIKRSQAGAEFKCEISKTRNSPVNEIAKWQPKVKLQRLRVLDHMVTDLKQSRISLSRTSLRDSVFDECQRSDSQTKLSRSNSASNLIPVKSKQRRLSDYNYSTANSSRPNNVDTITFTDVDFKFADVLNATFENRLNSDSRKDTKDNKRKSSSSSKDADTVSVSTHSNGNGSKTLSSRKRNRKKIYFRTDSSDDSDNEIKCVAKSKHINKDPYDRPPTNDHDNLIAAKKVCASSDNNENEFTAEDKLLKSAITHSRSFDDNDNCVIKVDSSDESETTIEILPASPDISQESESPIFQNINNKQMLLDNAIPTQLELELELMDKSNMERSDLQTPGINENHPDHPHYMMSDTFENELYSRGRYTEEEGTKMYFREFEHSSRTTFKQDDCTSEQDKHFENSQKKTNKFFYCNDLLVKEVLAAKETLKKCLIRSETESNVSRPKTAAEKKQGISYEFKDVTETNCRKSESGHRSSNNDKANVHKRSANTERKDSKSIHKTRTEKVDERHSKRDKRSRSRKRVSSTDTQDVNAHSMQSSTASTACANVTDQEPTTISLKGFKQLSRIASNVTSTDVANNTGASDISNKDNDGVEKADIKSTQSLNSERPKGNNDNVREGKTKEENMPLLVPEIALNFDPSSDRDSSRSPPVITNQDEADSLVVDPTNVKNKMITPIDESKEEKKLAYENSEMSIADIITQLAYHEKATIKHRRYCNLCERWFPTTSRHQRHLSGYQHRYIELTQRKSIHALFILFTGKPCPRLIPANILRNDCSIGELTPLQIALQDVAKWTGHKQDTVKTKES